MAKSNYSAGKRQRERDKARKREAKSERRESRGGGGADIPIATVDEVQGGAMRSIEEVVAAVHGRASTTDSSSKVPGRLFLGGLDWSVTPDELREKLATFGPVQDVIIPTDRDTGDSRGFGFVTMADRKDAAEAIRKLNGNEFRGRTLVVRYATERQR